MEQNRNIRKALFQMEPTTDIAKKIWSEKYQFKSSDGSPIDETLDDTCLLYTSPSPRDRG